jgi:hypothetical protein
MNPRRSCSPPLYHTHTHTHSLSLSLSLTHTTALTFAAHREVRFQQLDPRQGVGCGAAAQPPAQEPAEVLHGAVELLAADRGLVQQHELV